MALSQQGATYPNQAHIKAKDRLFGEAHDYHQSAILAIAKQTNASINGTATPPTAPSQIAVSAQSGFAQVTITHNNAPSGAAYLIEYSTTANFQSPIRIDNGISQTWGGYLKGQRLYWRAASTFYTSEPSQWIYLGSAANPTAVNF